MGSTLNIKRIITGVAIGLTFLLISADYAIAIFVSAPQDPIEAGDITSTEILNFTITDVDISSSSAINWGKIASSGAIFDANVNTAAAIAWGKIASSTAIDNSNISLTANIQDTKLNTVTSTSKVSGSALFSLGSIPSGAGSIPSANLGNLGMTLLASTTLVTNDLKATATSSATRRSYIVIAYLGSRSTSIVPFFRLNDNNTADKATRRNDNGVQVTDIDASDIPTMPIGQTSSTIIMTVTNIVGSNKLITWQAIIDGGASSAPTSSVGVAVQASTTMNVNNFTFFPSGTTTYASGTRIWVYGSAD